MHTERKLQIMLTCEPTIRYGRMGKTEELWQKGPVLFRALNWKKQQIVLVMTSSYRHRFKPGTSGLWQSARSRSIAPLYPSKAARNFNLPVGRHVSWASTILSTINAFFTSFFRKICT